MDILFISYKYPPSIGGMQKQSYHLINGFSDADSIHKIIYDQKSSLVFFFIFLFWRVPTLLRKHPSIEIIHLNDGVCAICCAWMKLLSGKIVVATYHGLDLVFPNVIYQKLLLPIVKSFDAFITVSAYTSEQCVVRGFEPHKVYMIKNGVDHVIDKIKEDSVPASVIKTLDDYREKGKKIIVAVGRPVKRKGFAWFVDKVLRELPEEYIFILIGPEPKQNRLFDFVLKVLPKAIRTQIQLFLGLSTEHKKLNALANLKDFKNRFQWYKNADHNTKNYILSQSDVMVMPNVKVHGDMEGFGLVALEANMYNVPVVAADLEGITSAITHRKNGLLIPSENQSAWLKALTHDLNTQGWSCSGYVTEQFNWNKMADEYREVFAKLIYETKKSDMEVSEVYL